MRLGCEGLGDKEDLVFATAAIDTDWDGKHPLVQYLTYTCAEGARGRTYGTSYVEKVLRPLDITKCPLHY